jgi:ribonucleoside-diphosphate reductase alpha chain
LHNCCEIGLYGYDEYGNSGWEFCNLTTINVKKCKTEDDFYSACKASAIVGTIQATYNKFPYLGEVTENINKREALLGCSMTGVMDNPEISLNPEIQRNGASIVLHHNERIAKLLGINAAARGLTLKPEGTASCLLGTSSGIHPHHSKRYIRRVQANIMETPLQYFEAHNPRAVEKSVWSKSGKDNVISFLCEVPDGAIVKNQMSGIDLLKKVMLTQQNWVEAGTTSRSVQPWLRHNVSNTISVKKDEWDEVEKFIYDNKQWFGGISLLPFSGDLDYPQAPFSNVLNERELIAEYGEGSLFASGLIVDGLVAFNNNL